MTSWIKYIHLFCALVKFKTRGFCSFLLGKQNLVFVTELWPLMQRWIWTLMKKYFSALAFSYNIIYCLHQIYTLLKCKINNKKKSAFSQHSVFYTVYKTVHFPPLYLASRVSLERAIRAAAADLILIWPVPDLEK